MKKHWGMSVRRGPSYLLPTRGTGRFPFNPKFQKFQLVHQMEWTISVWSNWNIRDQLWRWSTLTGLVISVGRSDWNVPFHLTNLLSPVPLFCILLTRTITKHAVAWVGSVQPECTISLGTWNFRNFKPEHELNGKCPESLAWSYPTT